MNKRRDFLVWCPVGARPLAPDFGRHWDRMFDLVLCDYEATCQTVEGVADHFPELLGVHKWPAINGCFKEEHGLWNYSYFLFLDDDVKCSWRGINHLFQVMSAHRADLFQATLSRGSNTAWSFLKQMVPSAPVRPVDFVEIMMPGFSRQALSECFGTFGCSESGWGLDKLWPKCVRMARAGIPAKVLVTDNITFAHENQVTSGSWVLSNGLTPMQDMPLVEGRYLDTLNPMQRENWEVNR